MAWFHKTLTDMRRAIDEEDWQKVKDIADEHLKPLDSRERDEGLTRAAILIQTYDQQLSNISAIIGSPNRQKAKTPVGGEIVTLKNCVKSAQEAMQQFEIIIKKMIKASKFKE